MRSALKAATTIRIRKTKDPIASLWRRNFRRNSCHWERASTSTTLLGSWSAPSLRSVPIGGRSCGAGKPCSLRGVPGRSVIPDPWVEVAVEDVGDQVEHHDD